MDFLRWLFTSGNRLAVTVVLTILSPIYKTTYQK